MAAASGLNGKKKCQAGGQMDSEKASKMKSEIQSLSSKVKFLQVSADKAGQVENELQSYKETFGQLFNAGVIDGQGKPIENKM